MVFAELANTSSFTTPTISDDGSFPPIEGRSLANVIGECRLTPEYCSPLALFIGTPLAMG